VWGRSDPLGSRGKSDTPSGARGMDPPDALDRQKCLEALAALRQTKWFQVCVSFFILLHRSLDNILFNLLIYSFFFNILFFVYFNCNTIDNLWEDKCLTGINVPGLFDIFLVYALPRNESKYFFKY